MNNSDSQSPKSSPWRLVLLGAFIVFALVSAWFFLSYQSVENDLAWGDPRTYPNSLLVRFTLGEYFETFGPRMEPMGPSPQKAFGKWLITGLALWVVIRSLGLFKERAFLTGMVAAGFGLTLLGLFAWSILIWPFERLNPLFILSFAALFSVPLSLRNSMRSRRSYHRLGLVLARDLRSLLRPTVLPVALLIVLGILAAATPGIQSDGLRYHLGAAQVWNEQRSMASIEGMAFSHFPALIDTLYLITHPNEMLGKLYHFTLFLLCLPLLALMTRQLAKWAGVLRRERLGWLAVTLAVTTPALIITSTWSFIDAGVVLFALAATFAHALWWHTGRLSHLVLAAALAGLMIGTKYTALVPACALGVGVLVCNKPTLFNRRFSISTRLKHGVIFGVISLAIASPWFIRNWAQTGNPTHPLANSIFQAEGWDEESQTLWELKAGEKGVGNAWWQMPTAWWGATFRWAGGEGVRPGGFEDQSIGLVPWLLFPLGLIGLVAIAWRRGGWWWFYLVFLWVNWALWFKTYQSNRMLLSTLIMALPGMIVGLAHLARNWRALWVAAMIALGVATTYQGLWIARYFMIEQYPIQLTLGYWHPDEWRSGKLTYYDGARAIRARVPEDEQALIIGESRRYYFPPNVVMSDWFDPPAVRRYLESSSTVDEMTQALAADGITHVFINHPELCRFWQAYPSIMDSDGSLDVAEYWRLWGTLAPPTSNLHFFRGRFTDEQADLLSEWITTVPHELIWRGNQPHTVGAELWRLAGTAAPSDL